MTRNKFTLIELLVVIAIIGILSSILLPVLSNARLKTIKAVCLSQTRQHVQALTANSDNYDGRISDPSLASSFPWDYPIQLYQETGEMPRNLFYCPLRTERNTDAGWNWKQTHRVTGYGYAWLRGNLPDTLTTHEIIDRIDNVSNPTENPFVFDTVIKYNGNFYKEGGASNIYSSHFPEGYKDMNIAYTDGHAKLVKWGNFWMQMTTDREVWW